MSEKTAKIIDGKALAKKMLLELRGKVIKLSRPPGLAAVLIGVDAPSQLFVKNKKRASVKVGIDFHDYLCHKPGSTNTSETEILEMINFLNKDTNIDAIIVQLPIPKQFDTQKIINKISPAKDADGFHPKNTKKFMAGKSDITPPLILAVTAALEATKQNLKNKTAVIISKNPIFSGPLKIDLEDQGLKVTAVKPDKNLKKISKTADVLLVILGQPAIIKKEMIKENAIVIDMGTNLIAKDKWVGDVDPGAAQVASFLTPVPGGIGPLTVACLLKNTYNLAKKNQTT